MVAPAATTPLVNYICMYICSLTTGHLTPVNHTVCCLLIGCLHSAPKIKSAALPFDCARLLSQLCWYISVTFSALFSQPTQPSFANNV